MLKWMPNSIVVGNARRTKSDAAAEALYGSLRIFAELKMINVDNIFIDIYHIGVISLLFSHFYFFLLHITKREEKKYSEVQRFIKIICIWYTPIAFVIISSNALNILLYVAKARFTAMAFCYNNPQNASGNN